MPKFEVQTNTVFDGWVNCWHEDDGLVYYETREQAQAAIDEFFEDLPAEMADSYTRDDYRVVPVKDGNYIGVVQHE